MLRGVSLIAMKGSASCFKGVWVMSGCLKEFQPGLMLNDVEDLVDREVQRVKVMEPSSFAFVERASSFKAGARCPFARFLELSG